jgi:flagellar L-ring protein precursor FlgH
MRKKLNLYLILIFIISALSACQDMRKQIKNIGKPPKFKTTDESTYQLAHNNPPAIPPAELQNSNSLWLPQQKNFFFKDRKAKSVGDILKVKVSIEEKAKIDNSTSSARNKNDKSFGVPNLFGLEKSQEIISSNINPSSMLSITGKSENSGTGKIDRKETINTTIAAIIYKILPNGNFFIKGSQEIRVNFEMREITLSGIIRPEDLDSENSVDLKQVAEARVSYGGRGQITSMQQPTYGKQFLDIVSPF